MPHTLQASSDGFWQIVLKDVLEGLQRAVLQRTLETPFPKHTVLEHLGEKAAAARLMRAIERVTADKPLHTPDLGGNDSNEKGDPRGEGR